MDASIRFEDIATNNYNQSSTVSDNRDALFFRSEVRGMLFRTIEPYSLEVMRRSKSTSALRCVVLQSKRLSIRRKRSAARGTVSWCS